MLLQMIKNGNPSLQWEEKKKKSKDNSFALEQGRISNKQFKLKIFR